jgi:sulfite reductase (NADPH) hemoprotein beta-component
LRLHALACVGLPTCGLAMAESERYLPALLGRLESLLEHHGLGQQAITLRMTGCPNGCARPYLAEIGLVGKAPGRYNLHLGAAANGTRLNRLWRENIDEDGLLEELDTLFAAYAAQREVDESFGDFVARTESAAESRAQVGMGVGMGLGVDVGGAP